MWYVDALFDTPGAGGAAVCIVIVVLIVCYSLTVRWISRGCDGKTPEYKPKGGKHG